MIPFKLFALFESSIGNVVAAEKLSMVQAFAHGQAVAMNGRSAAVESETRKLSEKAFPQVVIEDADS